MILIEGVHGGGTHAENVIGGVVFVVVNVLFYYFLFQWVLGRMFNRRVATIQNNDSQPANDA